MTLQIAMISTWIITAITTHGASLAMRRTTFSSLWTGRSSGNGSEEVMQGGVLFGVSGCRCSPTEFWGPGTLVSEGGRVNRVLPANSHCLADRGRPIEGARSEGRATFAEGRGRRVSELARGH